MSLEHLTMPAHSGSLQPAFRNPKRITITIPFHAFHTLQERSDDEGRSLSNLASYLLETALGRDARA